MKINYKKIGIIGGMGPESTAEFYMDLIKICQDNYLAKYDSDYPQIIINSVPIEDVVEDMSKEENIISDLINAAKILESAGCDFLVMPCNTAHYFFEDIQKNVSIPMMSIVKETAKKIIDKGFNKVGLLATDLTVNKRIYESVFDYYNINSIKPSKKDQLLVTETIMNILAGKKSPQDKQNLSKIIKKMINLGAEAIVLGCTDLPIVLKQKDFDIELIDSSKILAKSTIVKALKQQII